MIDNMKEKQSFKKQKPCNIYLGLGHQKETEQAWRKNLSARSNTATLECYFSEFTGQPNYRTNLNKEARI